MEEQGLALKKSVSSEQKQNNTVINMYGKVRFVTSYLIVTVVQSLVVIF